VMRGNLPGGTVGIGADRRGLQHGDNHDEASDQAR
jgi:hypothetical protein